jgi:hypothetical protein
MIAIDAAGEEAEQHKTCPEALVSAETPGETHTFIRMSVAVFKPVCTLVHDSFMFNWHTLLRDYAHHLGECRSDFSVLQQEEHISMKDALLCVQSSGNDHV